MSIDVTTFGHSAIRFEKDGARLATDPGGFSDLAVLDGAAAVLITHEHPDHVQVPQVVAALAASGELEAWAPQSVVDDLVEQGAPADRVHVPTDGEEFTVAGFRVRPTVTEHAQIHPEIPIITNIAYVIDDAILHPGDSLSVVPQGLELLLVPVAAPWSKVMETVEYVRAVAPARVMPIHDGILSDDGRGVFDGVVTGLLPEGTEYARIAPGEELTVGA